MKNCIKCGKRIDDLMDTCPFCKSSQDTSNGAEPIKNTSSVYEELDLPVIKISETVKPDIEEVYEEPVTLPVDIEKEISIAPAQNADDSINTNDDGYYDDVVNRVEEALKKNKQKSVLVAFCMMISVAILVLACLSVL